MDSHQTNSAGTVPAPTAKHTGPGFNHENIFSALQDENAAMQSQDSSESSKDWITPKKWHREKRIVNPHAQHNSPRERIKLCRDCNAQFTLSDETQTWFHDRGLQSQACCQACRLCHKQNIAAQTARTTPLVIRQTTSAPRSVTNATSYASIVSAAKSSPEPTGLTTGNLLKINEDQIDINNEQPSDTKAATKDQVPTDTEQSIQNPMHTILEASSNSSGNTPNRDGHTEADDNSSIPDNTENDPSDANSTSSLMPNLEEDSSLSSVHGRFWDSSSDNQEVDLPTTAQWRPIQDLKRRRHLEYTLSHPNKRRRAPRDGEGQCAGCDASEGYVLDVEVRLHNMQVHDQVFITKNDEHFEEISMKQ